MVEVSAKGGGAGAELTRLRERVERLTEELDRVDARVAETARAYADAVQTICLLLIRPLPPDIADALEMLRSEISHEPPSPRELYYAVATLKTAILAGAEPGEDEVRPDIAAARDDSQTGRHVALALMAGLRLGEAEFDERLEESLARLQVYMESKQVRPAMALVTDLLDQYRAHLESRRTEAELALREVLQEVISTESEISQAWAEAEDSLVRVGRQYDDGVRASMGRLVRELEAAGNLEALKVSALEHLRNLRDGIKARQEQEREAMDQTREALDSLKSSLSKTKERMQRIEAKSQRLTLEALTDPLTGVLNKRAFNLALAEAMDEPRAWPLSLLVLDIDHFKNINDHYGHQAGDKALKAIADQAKATLRRDEQLYRYAGDEFVIILHATNLESARLVGERVRQATHAIRFTYRGKGELRMTVSLGVAEAAKDEDPESLFERADEALFEAKRQGRDRVGG